MFVEPDDTGRFPKPLFVSDNAVESFLRDEGFLKFHLEPVFVIDGAAFRPTTDHEKKYYRATNAATR